MGFIVKVDMQLQKQGDTKKFTSSVQSIAIFFPPQSIFISTVKRTYCPSENYV